MALIATELTSNFHAQVIIHIKDEKTSDQVVGFISDDITIGSSADWQSPMDVVGGALKTIQSLKNLGESIVNALVDAIGFGAIAQKSLSAYATTVVDYMGTNKPTFSLPLIFVATRPTDDPRVSVLKLLKCVYPSVDQKGSQGLFMRAPLGYARGTWQSGHGVLGGVARSLSTPSQGYVSVSIGNWLSFQYLVINDVKATFSKETTRSTPRVPLYARADVSFTFIVTPSYDDVVSWFRGLSRNNIGSDPTKKNKAAP